MIECIIGEEKGQVMGKSEFLKDNRDELTGLLDKHAFIEWGQELINTRDKQVEYGFVFFDNTKEV